MATTIEIGEWLPAPARAVRAAFAVGDVHGRDDLLQPLLEAIERIIQEGNLRSALVVMLGDYIDRGPQSIGALNRALDLTSSDLCDYRCLPGNHEQFLRAFLAPQQRGRKELLDIWLRNGGNDVARELDFLPENVRSDMKKFSAAIVSALGRRRLDCFLSMPNHVRMGSYLFVHAGIHPQLGLSMLDRDWRKLPSSSADEDADPLWIRGPFLTYKGEHQEGVVVVHGHTPRNAVELLANRIGIDTRAYDSGRLTACTADGSECPVYTSRWQAARVRLDQLSS